MAMEEETFKLERRSTKGMKWEVRNSYCLRDAYNWYKKNAPSPVSRDDFSSIIQEVDRRLADAFVLDGSIDFPEGMGGLYIEKRYFKGIKFEKGKMKIGYKVNWAATIQLWKSDKDAFEKRTLVRFDNDFVCRIRYERKYADYTNKTYMSFSTNTFLKKRISAALRNNSIPVAESFKIIN